MNRGTPDTNLYFGGTTNEEDHLPSVGSGYGPGTGRLRQLPERRNPAAPAETKASEATEAPADTKKYEGVELTMWSMWTAGEAQAQVIQAAADAFEADTGAHVNIEWKGRDVNTLLSAALESGEKLDIFEDDYNRIGNAYAPYTYDLTEMAAAAGYDDFSYACFNEQSKAWAGYLNSIVEQPQIGGIFYNKDAFEASGITETPKTWDEFLDVCQTLKDNG